MNKEEEVEKKNQHTSSEYQMIDNYFGDLTFCAL